MKKLTFVCTLLVTAYTLLLSAPQAHSAVVAAADQSGGYSMHVLDAVVKKWRPPLDGKERTIRTLVMIDGNGNVDQCMPLTDDSKGSAEKAACNAVYSIGKLPPPPYGLPMDVFLSFWVGDVDGAASKASFATTNAVHPEDSSKIAQSATTIPENTIIASISTPKEQISNSDTLADSSESNAVTSEPLATDSNNFKFNTMDFPQVASLDNQAVSTVAKSNHKPFIQENRSNAVLDENDYYVKTVMRKISPHVEFPPDLPPKELSTSLTVQIDGRGNIKETSVAQTSGHADLDQSIIRAAQRTGKVNPPPDNEARELFLTFIVKSM